MNRPPYTNAHKFTSVPVILPLLREILSNRLYYLREDKQGVTLSGQTVSKTGTNYFNFKWFASKRGLQFVLWGWASSLSR